MNKLIKRVTIFAALGGALLSLAELQGAVRDPRLDTEAFLDDYLSLDVERVSAAMDVLTENSMGNDLFDCLLTDGFVSGQTEKTATKKWNKPIFLERATRLLQQIPEEVFQNPNKGYPLKLNNIDLVVMFKPGVGLSSGPVFKTFAAIENRSVHSISKCFSSCSVRGKLTTTLVLNEQLDLMYFEVNTSLVDAPEALTRIQPPTLTLGEVRGAVCAGSCITKEGLQWDLVCGAGKIEKINEVAWDEIFGLSTHRRDRGENNAFYMNVDPSNKMILNRVFSPFHLFPQKFVHSFYCRDKEGGWNVYIKYSFHIRTLPERTVTFNCNLRHKMVE